MNTSLQTQQKIFFLRDGLSDCSYCMIETQKKGGSLWTWKKEMEKINVFFSRGLVREWKTDTTCLFVQPLLTCQRAKRSKIITFTSSLWSVWNEWWAEQKFKMLNHKIQNVSIEGRYEGCRQFFIWWPVIGNICDPVILNVIGCGLETVHLNGFPTEGRPDCSKLNQLNRIGLENLGLLQATLTRPTQPADIQHVWKENVPELSGVHQQHVHTAG